MAIWNPFKKQTPLVRVNNRRPVVRRLKSGETSRLVDGWTTTPADINAMVKANQKSIRARSREAYHDNDYARRFVSLCTTNIIGAQGVQLQVKTRNRSGSLDTLANDTIEEAWNIWAEDPELCDVQGMMPFHEMENLGIKTVAVDGEAFIREVTGRNSGPAGYSLLYLDPELFDVRFDQQLANGNKILQSIEFDQFGRRVAYYMRSSGQGEDIFDWMGKSFQRIPASEIIHIYMREAVGQIRGLPWMKTGLFTIKLVDGYDEAAIVAARAGAAKMGFYEDSPDGARYEGDDLEDSEDPDGELLEDFEAGSMTRLPSGVKFQGWDPAYPHAQYSMFHDAQVRRLAAGLGVSFHSLAADLKDVNFSSIRHGTLEERDVWRCLQKWYTMTKHRRVYRKWLTIQLARGSLMSKGRPLNDGREAKFQRVLWQARGWDWVSPKDDVTAKKGEVELGSRSLSSVIRERGGDPDEVFREIAEERKKMDELGITPSMVLGSVLPSDEEAPEEGAEEVEA